MLHAGQVYRHVLGHQPARDELLVTEEQPDTFLAVSQTKDGAFLLISASSKTSSEVSSGRLHSLLLQPLGRRI